MPLDMLPPPSSTVGEESREQAAETLQPSLVRLLTSEEIQTLAPVFAEAGQNLPPAEHSFVLGSVAPDGHVVAFLVVQLRVHAEPMWIEKGYESLFRSLVHRAEQTIAEKVPGGCDVFLFAPAGKVSMLASKAGMRLEPWTVWSKHVDGMIQITDEEMERYPGETLPPKVEAIQ